MEEALHGKMRQIRLQREKELQLHHHEATSALSTFRNSLASIHHRFESIVRDQETLKGLMNQLRQLEDELVAVKVHKEGVHLGTLESLSAAKRRTEELKEALQKQHSQRDEYKAIISQQLLALSSLEENGKQDRNLIEEFQQVISWYNRVLGIQIDGGNGVKFIFTEIDAKNPKREFSFTIRHFNGTYTLSNMDPFLDGTQDLMQELNQTNSLFKFVRLMREKFLAALNVSVHNQNEALSSENNIRVERTIDITSQKFSMSCQ